MGRGRPPHELIMVAQMGAAFHQRAMAGRGDTCGPLFG
jgi:hypothetical protein